MHHINLAFLPFTGMEDARFESHIELHTVLAQYFCVKGSEKDYITKSTLH